MSIGEQVFSKGSRTEGRSRTITLAALYFAGGVGLQRVFIAVAGHTSTLAVVAFTLVIAALFNPL